MKTLKFIVTAVIALTLGTNSFAQNHDHSKMVMTKTEMIKVSGNCETCKARIEKAAKVEGVIKANWSMKTKMLTLVYDPSKVLSQDVQRSIAAVGHDTRKFKATTKTYNSLPGCCKYDRVK